MKRLLFFALALCILISGCHMEENYNNVSFYYPRDQYLQNSDDSVIAPEIRSNEEALPLKTLLDLYFQGPVSPALANPFPEGTKAVSVNIMGNVTLLVLTDDFAQLTGLDLVIACAAISKTVTSINQTPVVQISCQDSKLDGKNHITIEKNTICYLDTVPTETAVPPTEE